jgi:hypothetical protein
MAKAKLAALEGLDTNDLQDNIIKAKNSSKP